MAAYDSAWIGAWLGHHPAGVTRAALREGGAVVPRRSSASRRVASLDGAEPFPPLSAELLEVQAALFAKNGDAHADMDAKKASGSIDALLELADR